MQAMILTCPAQRSQVSMSMSPKAPTVGKNSLEPSPQGAYFWCIHVFARDGIYAGFAGAKTCHRRMALGRRLVQPVVPGGLMPLASPTPFSRRDTHTKFAVRSQHPRQIHRSEFDKRSLPARGRTWMSFIQTCQIHARLRYQGSQLGDEVQRFEYDVGSAVPVGGLKLVADISVGGYCQALLRHRWPGDVAAQVARVCRAGGPQWIPRRVATNQQES